MQKQEKIAILLTTYNSDKYIEQQLDSLISQTDHNWDLYIRDDGSKDKTIQIIQYYAKKNHNIHFLQDKKNNLGAMKSFLYLLAAVDSEYYMFCDHDDVWLHNKIELSRAAILRTEKLYPDKPVVVHTDLHVVDDKLEIKHNSFWKYSKINPSILEDKNYMQVFNCVTGCTMLFNSLAKAVSLPYPESAPMHDWWVALNVIKTGFITHLDCQTILYRQHLNNEVGARNINANYFLNKIIKLKTTIKGQLIHVKFLRLINGHSLAKYYYYKIVYTILRNL